MTLEEFLKPLYQDLDGANRFDVVDRIRDIAFTLAPRSREVELLIVFSGLAKWLNKPRNVSRVLLTGALSESELQATIASLRRLDDPQSDAEKAVAAATLIDGAGVRALAERFAHARREGVSVLDVARETPPAIPDWMSAEARAAMMERIAMREKFANAILEEHRTSS